MTKVAILATVWLHLVVVGLFVGMESLRCEKLSPPPLMPEVVKASDDMRSLTELPTPAAVADGPSCGFSMSQPRP